MFFLLRMAFWLSLVLILLPSGSGQRNPSANPVAASEAISAASATVGDLSQFCTRQADACVVGSQVATELGYRVQAGARMVYELLTKPRASRDTGVPAAAQTHETGKSAPEKPALAGGSQNTLTPTDLGPAWRGPPSRPDGKRAA